MPQPANQPIPTNLIIIGVIVYFVFFTGAGGGSLPAPPDTPVPTVSDLSKEIAQAMKGTTPGTCERYAAFYWAAGEYISGDDGPKGLANRRDTVVKVKDALGLESPAEFGAIVKRELEPFALGDPDRDAYTAALKRLSDACRAAEQ